MGCIKCNNSGFILTYDDYVPCSNPYFIDAVTKKPAECELPGHLHPVGVPNAIRCSCNDPVRSAVTASPVSSLKKEYKNNSLSRSYEEQIARDRAHM